MNNSFNFLKPYLRGWPLILGAMVMSYLIADKYLTYVTPMYESTAKLRLADVNEGVSNSNLFKDLDVFATTQKLNAEIEVMKSHALIIKALNKIPFETQIFRVGSLRKKELFSESPIKIEQILMADAQRDKKFTLTVSGNNKYTIISEQGKEYKGKMKDTLLIGASKIVLSLNEPFIQSKNRVKINDTYEFIINSQQKLISEINKNLDIISVEKDVPIIRISYKSTSPEKAAMLPNALAEAYIEDYIDNKYSAANVTVDFLNDRIKEISSQLTSSEEDILDYRNEKNITNITQETETDLRKISQLKIQLTSLKMSFDAVKSLEIYIQSGKDNFLALAPNFEAFTDLLSTEIIKNIKQLQAEKKDLQIKYTDKDERVVVIEKKIKDLSSYLIESITNTRKNLEVKYNNLVKDIETAESVFIDVPQKEKMITILNREFQIYQQSYNFLNQKKIEAEIAKSAKIAFHRVITPAFVSKEPVSPNRSIIKIVSAILGMLVSIVLIFLVHSLKARVNDVATIESNSMIPLATTIPKLKNANETETFFLKMLSEWEVKELITPNGMSCLSGFNLNEGAQFIVQNLVGTFALQNRKVLLIDFNKAIYPNTPETIMPIKEAENVWVMNLSTKLIKTYSTEKIQTIIKERSKAFDHTLILNDQLNKQFALPLMAIANFNLVCLDTRLTSAKKVAEVDLLKEEYQIPHLYFALNRVQYNPSFVTEVFQFIKRLKLKNQKA